eukprot:554690_1
MKQAKLWLIFSTIILTSISRRLQNSQCDSIINNGETCVLNLEYSAQNSTDPIVCDPAYPKCLIKCQEGGCENMGIEYKDIVCPSNICESCDILMCTESKTNCRMEKLRINGLNCKMLKIDIPDGGSSRNDNRITKCIINAPGNGGTLEINTFAPGDLHMFTANSIISVVGTKNVVLNFNSQARNNLINGTYVEYLNFSCSGYSNCQGTNIICGSLTECNIDCTSPSYYGACLLIDVYSHIAPANNVNWYCSPDLSRVCYQATLSCLNQQTSSMKLWDSKNGWYYAPGACIEDFKRQIPPLSCTVTTTETCIVTRKEYFQIPRDMICNVEYKNCQILAYGTPINNASIQSSIFKCPSESCESCIIYCMESYSCNSATILGTKCNLLEIHIRADHQSHITIMAPSGGELKLLTLFDDLEPVFSDSYIYSRPETTNMLIDFGQCGFCINNVIDGSLVEDTLTVLCNNHGRCQGTNITCPNDANCNIDCASSRFHACSGVHVTAREGTHDVNWICDINSNNCLNTILECYIGISYWIYNETWQLHGVCSNPPSESPTATPTIPSSAPTIPPTSAPTMSPTVSPTLMPIFYFEKLGFKTQPQYYGTISGIILGGIILLSGLLWCIYYYKYKKPLKMREMLVKYINNACVLVITIGQYYSDDDYESKDIDGYLNDLDGIEHDAKNMSHLFHKQLNYDVFPASVNSKYPKIEWTKQELTQFLKDRAKYLENNISSGKMYDGLVVIVSCHGLASHLCTSDYKKYPKIDVHRAFSVKYPNIRTIPRFVLYDCCSGEYQKETRDYSDDDVDDDYIDDGKGIRKNKKNKTNLIANIGANEIKKNVHYEDENKVEKERQPWQDGEYNPDFNLAKISSSNEGFVSKLDSRTGSYLIHQFYKKYTENLDNNSVKFIHEIFDEIQAELHLAGKQHPEYTWNSGTRYIKFKPNCHTDLSSNLLSMDVKTLHTQTDREHGETHVEGKGIRKRKKNKTNAVTSTKTQMNNDVIELTNVLSE